MFLPFGHTTESREHWPVSPLCLHGLTWLMMWRSSSKLVFYVSNTNTPLKTSRLAAPTSYSKSSVAGYLHGFHHPAASFPWKSYYLGSGWSSHKGHPLHFSPIILHNNIFSSHIHCWYLSAPWDDKNHGQWARSNLCESFLVGALQIEWHYFMLL